MHSVSIVIPLYNGSQWIAATLDSVLRQSFPVNEIILVNNGSTDDSVAIASTYPGITLLESQQSGPHHARELGRQRSTGTLITFLDQDDLWHPDHLLILTQLLQKYPLAPAAIAGVTRFSESSQPIYSETLSGGGAYDPWLGFPFGAVDTPSAVLIRREALNAIGGWPKVNSVGNDWLAWFKLGVFHPLIRSDRFTVGYRQHSTSFLASVVTSRFRKHQGIIGHLLTAGNEALSYRASLCTEKCSHLQRRLDAFQSLADLVNVLVGEDSTSLSVAMDDLEILLQGESVQWISECCNTTLWLLTPSASKISTKHRITVLERLISRCPVTITDRRHPCFKLVAFLGTPLPLVALLLLMRRAWQPCRWRLTLSLLSDRTGRFLTKRRLIFHYTLCGVRARLSRVLEKVWDSAFRIM